MEIQGSVEIGRSKEVVFAYMNEPKNYVKWESGVIEHELTSEGPVGVGSKGRRVQSFMGTDESTWEITEFEENKVVAVTFESPGGSPEIFGGTSRAQATGPG